MRNNTKTRLSFLAAGTGAAALAVAGFALPANADTWESTSEQSTSTSTSELTAWIGETISSHLDTGDVFAPVAPETGVGDVTLVEGPLVSDTLNGDLLSGNQTPVGSGNDVPVGSGNEVTAPVGSGNDVSAPIEAPVGSGNDTAVDAPVGSGNDTSTGTDVSLGDIGADVDNLVDDVTGSVDDLTSDLGLGDILN